MLAEEEKKDRVKAEDQKEPPKTPERQPLTSARTPKQDQLIAQIALFESDIHSLKILLAGPNPLTEHRVKLMETVKKKENCLVQLKRCKSLVKASRKHRRQQTIILKSIKKPRRPAPGRPPLEDSEEFKELPTLILRIASQCAAADPRRRAELLSLPKSLNDLREMLKQEGMDVKPSTLYMRLIPRRKNSIYGRRHVRVVPVQLRKPQYDGRKRHVSARFCFAVGLMLRELASWFGPEFCVFLSPDDKATCPMGIPAATKQGQVLMHLEYVVKLPDHQYVIASRHSLKPSVYAFCSINPTLVGTSKAVKYVGPTAIRIRSCKHDSSTSTTHLRDLKGLLTGVGCADDWKDLVVNSKGETRPILILRPDAGPDWNPRHEKNQAAYVKLFRDLNLDALIIALHPEGYSAFNPVERRMAPLSRELIGVIFDHQHHGVHLNSKKETH